VRTIIAAFVTLAVAAGAAAQQPTFRAAAASVVLDVAVKRDGTPVSGLAAGDFLVTDNGVPQTVLDVSRESLPIDVTFIADLSGMVEGAQLDAFRRALDAMRRNLRNQDRGRLVVFDPRIREVQGLEEGGEVRISAENRPSDGGASALVDAVAVALVRDTNPDYRRMAILLTDGQDAGSFLDEGDLMEMAGRSDMAVFIVALTDGTTRVPQRPSNERMLRKLADTTGGALTVVQRDADLAASFVRELEAFRTSYVVRYAPTGVRPEGWHEIRVEIRRSGRFDVRARQGYVGMPEPAGLYPVR
jgi:VWFA-related protein